MVAAKDHSISTFPADFLHDRRVIHGARGDTLKEHDFGFSTSFNGSLGEISKTLTVIAFVMQDGDFLGAKLVSREAGSKLTLVIIGSDGAVEVRVITALGQRRIGRGRRNCNNI